MLLVTITRGVAHCVKILVITSGDISLVSPEVAQETSIFHIRHDNRWATSNAHTHTNQGHHIGMVKVFHLQNFICHVVHIIHCEKTCPTKKDHDSEANTITVVHSENTYKI